MVNTKYFFHVRRNETQSQILQLRNTLLYLCFIFVVYCMCKLNISFVNCISSCVLVYTQTCIYFMLSHIHQFNPIIKKCAQKAAQ